jgi:NAD(P)-dependent dehydrogenase (short-subunit alcohol dehydrogenase family)
MKNNILKKYNFKNKKIIILGGLGLIGSEITKEISQLGGKILVIDNNEKKYLRSKKNFNKKKIQYFSLNLQNINKIDYYYNKVLKSFGCPNIFINCSYPRTEDWKNNTFKDITITSLKNNINYHLVTYTYIAKLTAEMMKKKKIKGSLIQFSSIYGVTAQDLNIYKKTKIKENVSYSVIKGGIVNLTRQMASYYGKSNIRVNTVCPGGVLDNQDKSFIKNYSERVPLGRLANKNEIAQAVLFLASDASSYITGTTFMVDGGWSII